MKSPAARAAGVEGQAGGRSPGSPWSRRGSGGLWVLSRRTDKAEKGPGLFFPGRRECRGSPYSAWTVRCRWQKA